MSDYHFLSETKDYNRIANTFNDKVLNDIESVLMGYNLFVINLEDAQFIRFRINEFIAINNEADSFEIKGCELPVLLWYEGYISTEEFITEMEHYNYLREAVGSREITSKQYENEEKER